MKAMVYRTTGGPEVIAAEELPTPEPGPGEVLVRVEVSGVNPTDWKSRAGSSGPPGAGWQIPNQDGAGVVAGLGDGVDDALLDQPVWLWESAYRRPWGTAAEFTIVPASRVVPLGPGVPFELGAALGVPFLTAHRALTVAETLPDRLAAGSLNGRTVLVQGGAGAVGNAAIQLARWAGATVISTVSSPRKAALAEAAGSDHVVDYHRDDVVAAVRKVAPEGVDAIVEVAAGVNAEIDAQVLAPDGSVAVYASNHGDRGDEVSLPIRPLMTINARWQFVLLYTMPTEAKARAAQDVRSAVVAGAVRVGEDAGLPLHVFPLAQTAAAHAAVEGGAIGKVLVTVPA
jgi:NADPH:quinone reductase